MKLIKAAFVASALVGLGGCVAVPVSSGYYDYDAPAATYYAPPAYYGPSIGIGIYGGGRGYYGHDYYRRGYRHR